MSEGFPGMPKPPPAAKPREAAAVILFRRTSQRLEVFWIKREKALKFAGGFYAFPGGKVDTEDAAISVEHLQRAESARIVAAARELFEETGVLVARGASLRAEVLKTERQALLEKKTTFSDLLQRHHLSLDAAAFWEAGRWITPDFLPVRFDAYFFLVELPPGADAQVWPGELSEGAWVEPSVALSRWKQGAALLHPPNLHALQVMQDFVRVETARAQLSTPEFCPNHIAQLIEFQQGIRIFPMRTHTLPPATHTNCYILGNEELVLVDPGSDEVLEQNRLLDLMSGLSAKGKKPVAVVLTHHHMDHVGSAQVFSRKLNLPIWAHEKTASRLPLTVARMLKEGDTLELRGEPNMRFRVLHTPGHAQGHICLQDEASHAGIVGDMVAGLGTIVIDPPEGNMQDYLSQLRRLQAEGMKTLYPAHGPAIPDGPGKIDEYLHHRQAREDKLISHLSKEGVELETLVAQVYDDVPPFIWPLAERNSVAILEKLLAEGKVIQRGNTFLKVS